MMKIDRQYSSASLRIANESKVTAGEVALDSDTANIFLRTTTGWVKIGLAGVEQVVSVIDTDVVHVTGKSGNVAAAIATATLASVAGKTTYITGFTVVGAGATAGLPVLVTVTGLLDGTLTYVYVAAVGALVANTPLNVTFPVPIPASAANTEIVVTCPSLGAGNTHNAVVATGYHR